MSKPTRRAVEQELRALFDEVADIDWSHPAWRWLVAALAASEVWQGRVLDASGAADAFVTALEANSGPAADTFMATHGPAPAMEREERIGRALERAWDAALALHSQNRSAPDQRLLQTMRREGGWLRGTPLPEGRVALAFLTPDGAFVGKVDPLDPMSVEPLREALRDPRRAENLRPIDPSSRRPTPAAAAISLAPVTQRWARSFHRAAWTRGGGPWMGVADSVPFSVVSTCHAAVDGYAHARVTSAVLRQRPSRGPHLVSDVLGGVPGVAPPSVGFAARTLTGRVPRFATALHAFARVLDRHLGEPTSPRTVPVHVPIAPGSPTDAARWRRRPLYGLLALTKQRGAVEPLSIFAQRLPRLLAREASGRGVLTRVLRAALEIPVPRRLRRAMIHRQPWADRLFEPAEVLTGAGYLSWMRFPPGELPRLPTFPSAIPSFTGDGRGGAGLSIAHYDGGLAVGLTTSGSLGAAHHAELLLAEWIDALPPMAIQGGRASDPGA